MIVCFGLSWPAAIVRSWRARSSKGKSLLFMALILVGYLCGILAKVVSGTATYVLAFYVLNLVMVAVDICLFFRNARLDGRAGAGG